MPQTLRSPTVAPAAFAIGLGGKMWPGDYYISMTVLTALGGETLASPEVKVTIPAPPPPAEFQISLQKQNDERAIPDFGSRYRFYIGRTPLAPLGYVEYAGGDLPAALIDMSSLIPGRPPVINHAYLPDTDGIIFPASTVFGWLRDGLQQAADITGGIYDVTGIPTASGQAAYVLMGKWKKMSHAWQDGWQMGLGNKGDAFYRNKITASVSGMVFTDMRGVRSIIEYYPVPSRAAGLTTTITDTTATATDLIAADPSSFLLEQGLALLGGSEIVAYQTLEAPNMGGMLRGLGGTSPRAWPAGTSIRELNGRFAGYRYPTGPQPGDSALPLDVPPGWEASLSVFMESRYRESERRFSEAKALRDSFTAEMRSLRSSRALLLGPRQVGGHYSNETYGSGAGGGWLLP